MCLICNHFKDGKLTSEEAMRNLNEMVEGIGPEHAREVTAMIIEHEIDKIAEGLMEPLSNEAYDALFVNDLDIDFSV